MPSVEQTLPTGAALRRLRVETGRSVKEVSEALGWSSSKLSRIETSLSRVKPLDLALLLDFYEAPQDLRSCIGALLQHPVPRSRKTGDAVPDVYERYARLEEQATHISMYAAVVVPGLLQTSDYAAVIITNTTPTPENHLARTRMQRRMLRQAVLGRIPPPRIDVVLDETVLRRPIGDPAIMRRQMIRLQELSDRPEISVRIIPLRAGAHPALTGPFAILDFPEALRIPSHVWLDDLAGGVLRDRQTDVDRYRQSFAALDELSLGVQESAEVFASMVAGAEPNI